MMLTSDNTRQLLLQSGKEQFLEQGFEKASLRTICKNAGLTTGAFYTHFSGKEELFEALVEPMLSGFGVMYREVIAQELSDLTTGVENELRSITYAVAHKDEFRLLFNCSRGTKYEGFKEHLIRDIFYPSYQEVFDRYAGKPVDPALVRIILRMKFEEYMELIYGGYTMEEVKRLITQLTIFSEAGFHALLRTIDGETMRSEKANAKEVNREV
ncbi:MAG: TetR/AcrR family transcriptional regulator [Lachnospiraceae bacterium]|nr:TetR/AcrR family transcriptional regulator [Lachnospiraceae bacterium]